MTAVALTLVDSSSWIEALRKGGDPAVRERVKALLQNGDAAWCSMIRLELWNGAGGEAERKALKVFERDLPSLEINDEVWRLSLDLARSCRSSGLSIPSTDLLILACARHHGAAIDHCDRHFDEAAEALGGSQ